MARYITCADTAKLVRAALKDKFPTVKFSVRSSVYSGGASIDVKWTDGPTTKAVEAVVKGFEGATFDPTCDLKGYKDITVNGERARTLADWVLCQRTYSASLLQRAAAHVAAYWGVPAPRVVDGPHPFVDRSGPYVVAANYWTAGDLAFIACSDMDGAE